MGSQACRGCLPNLFISQSSPGSSLWGNPCSRPGMSAQAGWFYLALILLFAPVNGLDRNIAGRWNVTHHPAKGGFLWGHCCISYESKDNILFLEVFICFVKLTWWFKFRLCFSVPLNDLVKTGRTWLVQFFLKLLLLWSSFFYGKYSESMLVFLESRTGT